MENLIQEKLPVAKTIQEKIYNFQEFVNRSPKNQPVQIAEEVFDYFLGVLPPVTMGKTIKLNGKMQYTSFEFAEGWENTTAFWKVREKFYAQKTNRINRLWNKPIEVNKKKE